MKYLSCLREKKQLLYASFSKLHCITVKYRFPGFIYEQNLKVDAVNKVATVQYSYSSIISETEKLVRRCCSQSVLVHNVCQCRIILFEHTENADAGKQKTLLVKTEMVHYITIFPDTKGTLTSDHIQASFLIQLQTAYYIMILLFLKIINVKIGYCDYFKISTHIFLKA